MTIELIDDEQYYDIILATGGINDLEQCKWELMLEGENYKALAFQYRIDELLNERFRQNSVR